ncbi:MAG: hypothetical protein AAFV53_28325 [Myxococcota bacterium]
MVRSFSAALILLAACTGDNGLTTFVQPPIVTIQTPADGATLDEGVEIAIRGIVEDDAFEDVLERLEVAWTLDGQPICDDVSVGETGFIDCVHIFSAPGVRELILRVTNPDAQVAQATSVLTVRENGAPTISIQAPTVSGAYYTDHPTPMIATVADNEDGPGALEVEWSSSLDGPLRITGVPDEDGLFVSEALLSAGQHRLTATVTDTTGLQAEAVTRITIDGPNRPPNCDILAPLPGTLFESGETVLMDALATDDDVPASMLLASWSSDQDGPLSTEVPNSDGELSAAFPSLSLNTHTITLQVTDEKGAECSDSVRFKVGTGPDIALDAPLSGEIFNEGEAIAFQATVADIEDPPEDLVMRWESDLNGVFSEQGADSSGVAALASDVLDIGRHVITVTVEDTDALRASASAPITVNDLPEAPEIAIAPTAPTSSEQLVVSVTTPSTDVEGDAITYFYNWEVNGTLTALTTATVPAAETTRGDTWTVTVTPNDGYGDGASASTSVAVGNSAPILSEVVLSPDPAAEEDTLLCAPGAVTDPDGDPITYTYSWAVNGSALTVTASSLTGADFDKGDAVRCAAIPNDGFEDGDSVDSNIVTIGNTAPTLASVSLTPADAQEGAELICTPGDTDDVDGDAVTVTYAWEVDGVTLTTTASALNGDDFDKGDEVVCVVTPNDGDDDGDAVDSNAVTIQNTPPEIDAASLLPTSAVESSTLTCAGGTTSDADGDTVSISYGWEVNGIAISETTKTLNGDHFDKDDEVVCLVTPNDGEDDGDAARSSAVIIGNTAPELAQARLTPTAASASSTLTCTEVTTSDEDGDTVTVSYAWEVNGAAIAVTDNTLDGSHFDRDDEIVCIITPNDGTVDGDAVESNAVTIENTAPVLDGVSLSPTDAQEGSTLTCTPGTTTDIDGDPVSVSYVWKVEGTTLSETSATIDGADFDKGDEVVCEVTPDDGTDDGDVVASNVVTIQNTAPTVTASSLTPTTADEDTILTCTAGTTADVDGDTVTVSYGWEINGVLSEETTRTLSGDDFEKGDIVACVVTPSDGEDDGASQTSNEVTIQNQAPVLADVSLAPTDARERSELVCSAGGTTDADGDTVTVSYAWEVNGAAITAVGATLDGEDFDKDDEVVCIATPNDGFTDGDAVESNVVTILNTAPTVASASLTPDDATEGATLSCAAGATDDDDGDTVTVSYAWRVNGVTIAATTSTLTGDYFDKLDKVVCVITPADGDDEGAGVVSNAVNIENAAPSLTSATLSPADPVEASTLSCTPSGVFDPDGDTVTYRYAWRINGGTIASTGDSLSGDFFDKDDRVSCAITPTDGSDDGTAVSSNTVTVGNTAPTLASASISPTSATEASTLSCDPGTATDVDGDVISYDYTWSVNDIAIAETARQLTGTAFDKGDRISCTITPSDGDDAGGSRTAAAITIGNTAPEIASVDLSPTSAKEATTLTCSEGTVTDIDAADTVSVTYAWFVNGAKKTPTTSTLTGTSFDKGDRVYCVATPDDGDDAGAAVNSNTVTIQNTAPTIAASTLSFTGAAATESSTLTCASGATADVDGDAISVRYQWEVNEGIVSGVSANTLTGTYFDKEDDVVCVVFPDDGDDEGAGARSNVVTIGNTAPSASSATILPENAYTTTALSVEVDGWSDIDGDSEGYTYQWFADGVEISGATDATLAASQTLKNQDITVTVTPTDGDDAGAAFDATARTIQNTPPGAPEVLVTPTDAEPEDTLTCNITADSADDDAEDEALITYTYSWMVNGFPTDITAATVPSSRTSHNDTWVCTATPEDDEEAGTPGTDAQIVQDVTAPDTPTINDIDEYRNTSVVTIDGTAESGATVTVIADCDSGKLEETDTVNPSGIWTVSFTLTKGDYCEFSAVAEDAAGNVSDESNLVGTESCATYDDYDGVSGFSDTYGDTCANAIDEWVVLPDDSSVTVDIVGNIIDTSDADWYVFETSQTVTTIGTNLHNVEIELIDGASTFEMEVYRGSCTSRECSTTSDVDSYDRFARDDGDGLNHLTPSDRRYCRNGSRNDRCDDLSDTFYVRVKRTSGGADCTPYTLRVTNGY